MKSISKYKQFLAIFLLLLTSVRILVVPIVYLDFEINKAFIVQNLCENRFKPELNCDGKCYLAKQLHIVAEDKANKEAENQESRFKKILEETYHFQDFAFFQISRDFNIISANNFTYIFKEYLTNTSSLFHPPCLG
jgi:hypothetical protein